MTRPPAIRILGALAVACLLGGGGCAKGTPMQQDASVPQQDADVTQLDGPQVDATGDGLAQADGPKDGPLQQDGQADAPVQQDAQHDVLQQTDRQTDVGECSNDVDCLPDAGVITDGGRYCYTAKAKCYVPGTCGDDSECKVNETCRFVLGTCSCPSLGFTCRPHEICILFPGFGNFCSGE